MYHTSRWQRLRRIFLAKHPLCEDCEGRGITEPAAHVDHRKARQDGGADWDVANLRGLCASCHSRKTLAERRGRVDL